MSGLSELSGLSGSEIFDIIFWTVGVIGTAWSLIRTLRRGQPNWPRYKLERSTVNDRAMILIVTIIATWNVDIGHYIVAVLAVVIVMIVSIELVLTNRHLARLDDRQDDDIRW